MKTRLAALVILPALLTTFSTPFAVELQQTTPTPTTSAPSQPKQHRISDAASVILKLKRGDVSEQVIVAYIENAKRNFDLSAEEIVYLKQEGVTDKIVTAALNHHAKIPQPIVSVPQQTAAAPAPVPSQPTVVVAPPQTTYVQAAPPPVYVYSYPSYTYYDPFPYNYNYNPYRYSHFSYRYPTFSANFRFGHGFYGGYRHSYNVGGAHNFGHAVGGHFGGFRGGHSGHGGRHR
jgi:hypothetical protein